MGRPRDAGKAKRLRPTPCSDAPRRVPDSKVGQFLALLERSEVPGILDELLRGRPGPPGIRPRTVLVGLMLAAHYTGRATVADAWWILDFCLGPKAREWLVLPEHTPHDAHARIAASRRLYRALDRITTVLDPARCDRRTRLPLDEATAIAAAWEATENTDTVARLQKLCNRLVLTPVRLAQERGHLRRWNGDVGVDATSIPVMSRPPSTRSGRGSIEVTAGWHFSGGAKEGVFGYSGTLVVAAHTGAQAPVRYPQLCLGFTLDSPSKRIGSDAVLLLEALAELGLPTRVCAADRAYTDQRAIEFQTPVRRLGYRLALDFKEGRRGRQGSFRGAPLIDGCLACPQMPETLREATTGLKDKQIRIRSDELRASIAAREPFYLHRKEGPDERGAIRLQCPAAGPSPTVNCGRRERLHPTVRDPGSRPTAALDLSDRRQRAAHPAARPTVVLPEGESARPPAVEGLPTICRQTTMTVHADAAIPKYRQDFPYLSPTWDATYKPIRSHNEGMNGQLKGTRIDIGNKKHRPVRGRVAQHLLVAILLMIANLDTLGRWLDRNTDPTDLGHHPDDATDTGRPDWAPLADGRPPPHID